jgi:hypothetical protein
VEHGAGDPVDPSRDPSCERPRPGGEDVLADPSEEDRAFGERGNPECLDSSDLEGVGER